MKKPLAALIIAQMKKKPKPESSKALEMESEEGEDEGYVATAEEILSAIKEGDASAFAEALKAFIEQC